ncbi:HlyC/CorC family transporter [Candidatus Bipolaricaulota bacterium]|nr:HlyC/CorC family transporter [Candidatus Bipolaricaulota bacterium]
MSISAQFALLVFLIAASAYFSSTETALTSLARGRLRYLINTHPKKKRGLTHLLEEPNDLITALLVLNNLVNVMASSIMTLVVIRLLPDVSDGIRGLIAVTVMTVSLLIFGEITPKNFAKHNTERLTLWTINQVYAMTRLLRPFIFVFRAIAHGVGRIFGVNLSEKEPIEVSDEQIETLIGDSQESGLLDEAGGEMIRRILDFDEMTAEQVMVPRTDVQAIEINTSPSAAREFVIQDGHSRFPIYDAVPDKVTGTLYAKDMLACDLTDPAMSLKKLQRPAYYAPTTQPINMLLREFQRQNVHMAVVIDEFGGMAGIVTLEDILEEIVGEIDDEYDRPTALVKRLSADEALITGDTAVHDLNRTMDIDLPEDEGVTINGLVQNRLGAMAKQGDQVQIGPVQLIVERASDREITTARVLVDRSHESDESEN